MKTTMKALITMLALGASAWMVNAQNAGGPPNGDAPVGPPPGRFHRPPPLPLIAALDVNHDGVIDSTEIANASAELLTLDQNGDGQLTKNEYLPPLPADAPEDAPRPPLPAIVKALDANGDGVIDAREIANAPAALKTLDKNGDAQLTPDEFCPRPPRQNDGMENGGQPGPSEGAPDGLPSSQQ